MRCVRSCRILRHLTLLLPALLAATSHAADSDVPRLVQTMLANAPVAAEARCSYTRTRVDGTESRRERFRAGSEDPWSLIQVNGRAPTDAELRDYLQGADDRERRHPLTFDLLDLVDSEHWTRRSETHDQVVFGFRLRPNENLDERLVEKVRGTLVVDKRRGQPERIVIENVEPAYVAPLVRVAEYRQEMQFQWHDSVGAAVLTQAETQWRGRALGLKVVRRHKLVRYSDYSCAPATELQADSTP